MLDRLRRTYRASRYKLRCQGCYWLRGDFKGLWLPSMYCKAGDPDKAPVALHVGAALDMVNGLVPPVKKLFRKEYHFLWD